MIPDTLSSVSLSRRPSGNDDSIAFRPHQLHRFPLLLTWSAALLLTPLYTFSEGGMQPADAFFLLVAIPLLLRRVSQPHSLPPLAAAPLLRALFFFVLYAFVVNLT